MNKETKLQEINKNKTIITSIPVYITRILEWKKGTIIEWEINKDKKSVTIKTK